MSWVSCVTVPTGLLLHPHANPARTQAKRDHTKSLAPEQQTQPTAQRMTLSQQTLAPRYVAMPTPQTEQTPLQTLSLLSTLLQITFKSEVYYRTPLR